MYAAHAVAWRSSSSCTSSPPSTQEQTTSVGARSSFPAASGPAADFRRSSVPGPITRKRHGVVRLWLGAHRASSNSSSSTARSTGSGLNALCVRRVRIAVSTSIADTVSSEPLPPHLHNPVAQGRRRRYQRKPPASASARAASPPATYAAVWELPSVGGAATGSTGGLTGWGVACERPEEPPWAPRRSVPP